LNAHESTSRRRFLFRLGGLSAVVLAGTPSALWGRETNDKEIFDDIIRWGIDAGLKGKPLGDIMVAVGQHFLGKPYVAHSLEEPGEEHLVVNLRGFDCLTLVENSLSISRCLSSGKTSFDDFRAQLTKIRYAGGILKGYASRLHYFTDWMSDNVRKGIVKEMTMVLGGEKYQKVINFMTTHRDKYAQLSDTTAVARVRVAETHLSGNPLHRVPTQNIASILDKLQNGDIIGTVTSMEGIDIAHTGMVIRNEGTSKFLHAPLSGGAVTISEKSLAEYVQGNKSLTGIVVARPLAVAG
jgi:hypothetical protein